MVNFLYWSLGLILSGIVLVGASSIYYLHQRKILTLPMALVWVVFYYYLILVLGSITGVATLQECIRLHNLGEPILNPKMNLIPFSDGMSLSFILNIFCFVPLGFFCPIISKSYEQVKNVLLIGFGCSFLIELSQLFTLYRVTDVDDLIANTLGTLMGFVCFKLMTRLRPLNFLKKARASFVLPILYLGVAFIIVFLVF